VPGTLGLITRRAWLCASTARPGRCRQRRGNGATPGGLAPRRGARTSDDPAARSYRVAVVSLLPSATACRPQGRYKPSKTTYPITGQPGKGRLRARVPPQVTEFFRPSEGALRNGAVGLGRCRGRCGRQLCSRVVGAARRCPGTSGPTRVPSGERAMRTRGAAEPNGQG
jgi:hypothetical protein